MSDTTSYDVDGMTCTHCAESIREEVADLQGVIGVAVDSSRGLLEVTGESVTEDQVRTAVETAGYRVVGRA